MASRIPATESISSPQQARDPDPGSPSEPSEPLAPEPEELPTYTDVPEALPSYTDIPETPDH
jgi:hypothetical protein